MKHRILIVEDESIVALDIQTRLEAHGFDVIDIVSSGSRAIEKAKQEIPDLILMDINLKGSIDGVETASLIRREIDSPIIFLTAFADEKTIKKAKISDASGYILKPFRESELLVTIELAIKRSVVRKKIEENSNWLYSTLNYMSDAVITVSEDNTIIFLNKKAEELLRGEVNRGDTFEAGQFVFRENQRLFFRNGETQIDIDHRESEIFDEDHVKLGTVHFIQDITKQVAFEIGLENARKAAEDSNRAKSDFLANVTHELRTPLNTIMGMNSLLSELVSDNEASEMHSLIEKAADSLLNQVNELLELSELERGEAKIKKSRFLISRLLDEVFETFNSQIEVKSLDIHLDIDNIPVLIGDKIRIREVLSCIISNSVKFTRKGSISVRVRLEDDMLQMEFKDTGIGMSEEQIQKIFQQFTQIDGSRTRHFGGVGVGLTLVNQILDLMKGTISVKSVEEEGSEFSITIPVEISPDQEGNIESDKFEQSHLISNTFIKLIHEVYDLYKNGDQQACEEKIKSYRTKNELSDMGIESQLLFRLTSSVKLNNEKRIVSLLNEIDNRQKNDNRRDL